jgi:DnaJ-class molecular chaperone
MPSEGEGATPAVIHEHAFMPEREWWTRCEMCGLSEAAHATTKVCQACGGRGFVGCRDDFGNYDKCDACDGVGVLA